MSTQPIINKDQNVFRKAHDEKILVLRRDKLFTKEPVEGFVKIDFEYYQMLVESHGQFKWRSQMEVDPTYKQIIPYLLFNFEDTYFLMHRASDASEVRLRDKNTFGIGGHVRQADMKGKSIIDWARREFEEEVDYQGNFTVEPLGMINDDRDAVGKVHVGFVFLLRGDSPAIQIKSELKAGTLLTLDEAEKFAGGMEPWSQLVFEYLKS